MRGSLCLRSMKIIASSCIRVNFIALSRVMIWAKYQRQQYYCICLFFTPASLARHAPARRLGTLQGARDLSIKLLVAKITRKAPDLEPKSRTAVRDKLTAVCICFPALVGKSTRNAFSEASERAFLNRTKYLAVLCIATREGFLAVPPT